MQQGIKLIKIVFGCLCFLSAVCDVICSHILWTAVLYTNPALPNKGSLTLNLLTTTIVAPPNNASRWQMGFNSVFKGLNIYYRHGCFVCLCVCECNFTAVTTTLFCIAVVSQLFPFSSKFPTDLFIPQ